jgi:hypothetical protein
MARVIGLLYVLQDDVHCP